jgi:hypothetical protein
MFSFPRRACRRPQASPFASPVLASCRLAAHRVRSWLFAASVLACASATAAPTYQFSPVNQYNVQVTAAFWNPIMEYVSQRSGVTLRLKIGRTSADTTAFVLAQEVDFAFTNHLFSPERERMGWRVLARRDAPPVRASPCARRASRWPTRRCATWRCWPVATSPFPAPKR